MNMGTLDSDFITNYMGWATTNIWTVKIDGNTLTYSEPKIFVDSPRNIEIFAVEYFNDNVEDVDTYEFERVILADKSHE